MLLSVELTIDFHPVTCIWGHECCLEGLQEYQIFLLQTLLKISVNSHQRNSNSRMIQCNRTKFDGLRCIEVVRLYVKVAHDENRCGCLSFAAKSNALNPSSENTGSSESIGYILRNQEYFSQTRLIAHNPSLPFSIDIPFILVLNSHPSRPNIFLPYPNYSLLDSLHLITRPAFTSTLHSQE